MKLKKRPSSGQAELNISESESESLDELTIQFDSATGEGEEDLNPTKFSQAVTWATDWTTETVVLQLQRGVINLDPSFQRRDAWRSARKSKFIESLILGLPIPQIVLAEYKSKKGSFFVIDGKQRLLTLQQFCKELPADDPNIFRLSGLTIQKHLNGKSYSDLKCDPSLSDALSAFNSQTIRTVAIKSWPNEDFLYTLFLRLNSNSVPLSPQELRKALHPGPFIDYVEEATANSKAVLNSLGLTAPDFRMRDVEIVIRYYAFRNFIGSYRGNLKLFLDNTCKILNDAWKTKSSDIKTQFDALETALETSCKIFSAKKVFRKFNQGEYEPRFNRAVFDIFLFYFSNETYACKALAKPKEVREAFERLCETDSDFLKSLETSTKSTDVVKKRFTTWGATLSKVIGVRYSSPFSD